MKTRLSMAAMVLLLAACDANSTPATDAPARAASASTVAGVSWDAPPSWTPKPERPMRVATYELPGSPAAECAVFHFPATGGSVEANIGRWSKQFEGSPKPTTETREVSGLTVTLVNISGTYLAPGGPMMKSTGSKPDYQLHGAIVPGPRGNVFFKTIGPAATLAAHQKSLDALVASLRPAG